MAQHFPTHLSGSDLISGADVRPIPLCEKCGSIVIRSVMEMGDKRTVTLYCDCGEQVIEEGPALGYMVVSDD